MAAEFKELADIAIYLLLTLGEGAGRCGIHCTGNYRGCGIERKGWRVRDREAHEIKSEVQTLPRPSAAAERIYMSLLYSILGLMALSVFSVVALPILLVVFILGIAGAMTIFSRPEIKKIKLSQSAALSKLSPSEQAQG